MILEFLITIFIISTLSYIFHNSYNFQVLVRVNLRKKELSSLSKQTSGVYIKSAYFSSQYHITLKNEFKPLLKRQKADLIKCYSIVTFKTIDAKWELFFTLTKDSGKFVENIYLKCYPNNEKINSKAAIEKIHTKLEVYASHHALIQILNEQTTMKNLNSLLTLHEETLNIGVRYLQYKGNLKLKNVSKTKLLHKITLINEIKNKI